MGTPPNYDIQALIPPSATGPGITALKHEFDNARTRIKFTAYIVTLLKLSHYSYRCYIISFLKQLYWVLKYYCHSASYLPQSYLWPHLSYWPQRNNTSLRTHYHLNLPIESLSKQTEDTVAYLDHSGTLHIANSDFESRICAIW